MATTVANLISVLDQHHLLDPPQLDMVVRQQKQFANPRALVKDLLGRGWLTSFQANGVIQGKAQELVFGPYIIMGRLGQGGMGQVFKARHQALGQIVALKIIRKDRVKSTETLNRFMREIQAASQLSHPNIARAINADRIGSHHYFAMEYVEGIDLAQMAKKTNQLPPRPISDFMLQTADALQHAYSRGLVHRDIKPSNILITRHGQGPQHPWGIAKVLDMGLARGINTEDDLGETLTQAGTVVGTPDYISPEQARDSRAADIRSDIYSLGCTMYRLLTGRVPFPGGTGMEKLFKHQLEAAEPIRAIRPDIPEGLETVVEKMMAKNPDERYQTPAELCQALEPFTRRDQADGHDTPPLGIPRFAVNSEDVPTPETPTPTAKEPARRWSRRPFAFAKVAGAAAVVLLAGLAYAFVVGNSLDEKETPTDSTTKTPLELLEHNRIAAVERVNGLPPEAVAVLGSHRLRHWGYIQTVAFSPDGRLLAGIASDRVIRIWNAATGQEQVVIRGEVSTSRALAFSRDGKTLVTMDYESVRLYDTGSGRMLSKLTIPTKEGRPSYLLPDGQTLVLLSGRDFKLWDIQENRLRCVISPGSTSRVVLAPDGLALATWTSATPSKPGTVKIWDASTGQLRYTISLTIKGVSTVVLGAEGKTLGLATDQQLTVVNCANLQIQGRFNWPTTSYSYRLAFSPDGQHLYAGNTGRLLKFNLADFPKMAWEKPVSGRVYKLMVSGDGQTLATTGSGQAIRLWDASTGRPRFPNHYHASWVAFAGNGHRLLTGSSMSSGGKVLLWDLASMKPATTAMSSSWNHLCGLSSDRRIAILRGTDGLSVLDLDTNSRLGQLSAKQISGTMVYSADGLVMALISSSTRKLQIWDLKTFKLRPPLHGFKLDGMYPKLALSADGKTLAVASKGKIRLWNTTTGQPISTTLTEPKAISFTSLMISSDGKRVGIVYREGIVVWDAETGKELIRHTPKMGLGLHRIAFSPDGKNLLSWTQSSCLLWDVASGKIRANLIGTQNTHAVAFSTDNQTLATSDKAGRVNIWDVRTGKQRKQIQLPGTANGIAFAADSRFLATANANGTVYILRVN